MITVISPDRVVIGGGIAAAGDLLLDPIRAEMRDRVHDDVAGRGRGRDGRARHVGRGDRGGHPRRGAARTAGTGRRRSGGATADRSAGRDRVAYQPQYRQIEQALRERIATLRPGERLPSDAELCAEFGVSRMTARNAMQRLAEDGLIARGSRVAAASSPSRRRIAARTG